ncbi:MAG: DUF1175 family protein [Zoogloeaceae bacterium]|jgi:uncharacterized protein YfaT (DUF1175 family)|nr:DUF1175 family protein [Zoogloeaceae bacterium]
MDRERRAFLGVLALFLASPALALTPKAPGREEKSAIRLSAAQRRAVRAWIVRIAEAQLARGPSPRWAQRDCAGLVRFAVAEALAEHDARWQRSMGMSGRLPPDLVTDAERARLRHRWRRADGSEGAYVGALALVQENSVLVGRDLRLAQPADLLFFDQGDEQHLMLWTGRRVVYHNGSMPTPEDDGLRFASIGALLNWPDTRWRPEAANPNFAGIFSLDFLA